MKYLRRELPRALVCCLVLGIGFSIATATAAAQCVSGPQMLAGWDFDGLSAFGTNDFFPSSPDPDTEDRCAFATGLTRGWTLGSTSGSAANAWGGKEFSITSTNAADAISAGNFVTFTVRAVPGFEISLSDIGAHNIRRSNTGPGNGQWQYSVDGGSFTDIGGSVAWPGTTSSGNSQATIDLTAIAALQNLSGTTTVTFRLVIWGATNAGGTWYFREVTPSGPTIDLSINGTVALAPTAADAVVSGQVVDSFGSGVSGAMVTLVSPRGERRTVRTSSFGYFRFMEVETGETYVISVASKRYRFEPRSVMVGDNIDDLRFTALP